jgi:hypothetical protein
MTSAIHLICRREGTSYVGMTRWSGQPNSYRSCCWLLSHEQAEVLIGGWVYFHAAKADPSGFGGRIAAVEQGVGDMADRKALLFRAERAGRGQAWRGADHGMAHMSGVVDADFPHER